jgi:hypothetical protein
MHTSLKLTLIGAVVVSMVACERFEEPSRDQCEQAVSNLVSQVMGAAIKDSIGAAMKGEDKEPGQTVANELIKAVGTSLLVSAGVDDQKIAWCEVNMSLHDANCLRSAQSKADALACGFTLTDDGAIAKD